MVCGYGKMKVLQELIRGSIFITLCQQPRPLVRLGIQYLLKVKGEFGIQIMRKK